MTNFSRFGAIAQLVEHLHGMQGVSGSNPLGSIKYKIIINKNVFKKQNQIETITEK